MVYSAPASGGKTLVAEALLARALWRHDHTPRVALFVVPKRALADEKAAELARHFSGDGSYGWRVRVCHGEAEDARRAREGSKARKPPALIDDARADLRKQRKLAHKHGHSSAHDIVNMPESVDSDGLVEIPVIDYSETSGPDEVNCGVGPGCLSMAEADDNMPALAIA